MKSIKISKLKPGNLYYFTQRLYVYDYSSESITNLVNDIDLNPWMFIGHGTDEHGWRYIKILFKKEIRCIHRYQIDAEIKEYIG